MDSDSEKLRKLLEWQKRVVETMYENAGGGDPYAYIWQKKWDELKREAEQMQKEFRPCSWVLEICEYRDGTLFDVRRFSRS